MNDKLVNQANNLMFKYLDKLEKLNKQEKTLFFKYLDFMIHEVLEDRYTKKEIGNILTGQKGNLQ